MIFRFCMIWGVMPLFPSPPSAGRRYARKRAAVKAPRWTSELLIANAGLTMPLATQLCFKYDFTKFDLISTVWCLFPWFCSCKRQIFFFFAAINFLNEKNDVSNLYTIPGRMLLIRSKKSKSKYQIEPRTSSDPEKKLTRKSYIVILYRVSHSDDGGSWICDQSL